ncbi:hypothetical protein OSTOST_14767 [Ostertagia ostertagi]
MRESLQVKHSSIGPDETIEGDMAVNTFHRSTTKAFVPEMLEADHGHVVTVASLAGKVGVAGLVDYCTSKHGAIGFHESLTAELETLGKHGVKTTVACPYYVDTGMVDGVQTKAPILLPMLQPEYVVDCIMEAILTEKTISQISFPTTLICFLNGFLPSDVLVELTKYVGSNQTMDTFIGRVKKE